MTHPLFCFILTCWAEISQTTAFRVVLLVSSESSVSDPLHKTNTDLKQCWVGVLESDDF
jgi:hypothetical protein